LERETTDNDKKEISKVSDGKSLKELVNRLLDATDPDTQLSKAKELFKTEEPTIDQLDKATKDLVLTACNPFDSPNLRNTLVEIKKRNEQIIDAVSKDKIIDAGWDTKAKEKAQGVIASFRQFIADNKDELIALQFIYSKPYGTRHLTYEAISELADAIEKPPYSVTKEQVWQAYEQLEQSKVKKAGAQKLLTDIISLIRFTLGKEAILEPFQETVNRRFAEWLTQQKKGGRIFTTEQMEWLQMIKEHIATSVAITVEDLELTPFQERGGAIKAGTVFGEQLNNILEGLNGALIA
jgi:type I restriction enzyme R subunit